jgi:N-acetyl-D-muramate 6-phosphate phosphatase
LKLASKKMPVDFSRIKGLCFDIDGTLSDTDDVWVLRLTNTFHKVHYLFKNDDPQPFARRLVMFIESPMNSFYHLLDRLSLDGGFAHLYSKLSQNRVKRPQPFQLMNEARELLGFLSNKYPMTVVSARDEYSTKQFLDQFNLHSYFQEVVTSQTCEYTKPFPHPVRFAAQSMNLQPEDCLMIGDTTVDVLSGKAAGAQTVGLLCGFGTEKELRKAGADLVLNDLSALLVLFRSAAS